jgi:Na+/melibiose symporter-like transporter
LIIVNSLKARLYLLLAAFALLVLYVLLWVATGKDNSGKVGTLIVFGFVLLVCWAYTIRDKRRTNAQKR